MAKNPSKFILESLPSTSSSVLAKEFLPKGKGASAPPVGSRLTKIGKVSTTT